jgi:hypothetical protein
MKTPHKGTRANPRPQARGTRIPRLNAHQLRELAEAASSLRRPGGEPFFGVVRGGVLSIQAGNNQDAPKGAVFEIDTFTVEPRPAPTAVIMDCEGQAMDLVKKYDAVFWSEAAVEKFVFPYYASKSLWEAAAVLARLEYHWYKSVPRDTDPEPRLGGEAFLEEVPFALAHTPDSDWDSIEGHPADRQLHLLFMTPDGPKPVPLSDLDDPPAGWRPASVEADRARRSHAARGGA